MTDSVPKALITINTSDMSDDMYEHALFLGLRAILGRGIITHWTILATYRDGLHNIFPLAMSAADAHGLAMAWNKAEHKQTLTTYVAIPCTDYCA
jgi:hypothetical protein